jgi:hypothetical protein
MSWVGDKLRLDPDTARDFYQESCKQIVQHLDGIFRQTPVAKTDIIIMVGGFSFHMLPKSITTVHNMINNLFFLFRLSSRTETFVCTYSIGKAAYSWIDNFWIKSKSYIHLEALIQSTQMKQIRLIWVILR